VREKQAAFLFCRMQSSLHPLSLSFSHFVASAMNTNDQIHKKDGWLRISSAWLHMWQ